MLTVYANVNSNRGVRAFTVPSPTKHPAVLYPIDMPLKSNLLFGTHSVWSANIRLSVRPLAENSIGQNARSSKPTERLLSRTMMRSLSGEVGVTKRPGHHIKSVFWRWD